MLAVPILTLLTPLTISQATPIALLAVFCSAGIGVLQGLQQRLVHYRTALFVTVFAFITAPVGVWVARSVIPHYLHLLFACLLLGVVWLMWHTDRIDIQHATPVCMVNPMTSRLFWTADCTWRLLLAGCLTGFLSGLLGVGGGFILVGALRRVSNLSFCAIVATTLAVIAMTSAWNLALHLQHTDIMWDIAMPFMLAIGVGMVLGQGIKFYIAERYAQYLFMSLALALAIWILLKTFSE